VQLVWIMGLYLLLLIAHESSAFYLVTLNNELSVLHLL
jgi:hypothetical protein